MPPPLEWGRQSTHTLSHSYRTRPFGSEFGRAIAALFDPIGIALRSLHYDYIWYLIWPLTRPSFPLVPSLLHSSQAFDLSCSPSCSCSQLPHRISIADYLISSITSLFDVAIGLSEPNNCSPRRQQQPRGKLSNWSKIGRAHV